MEQHAVQMCIRDRSMQMQTFLKSVNLPGGFTDYVISGVKRITTIISASGVQILLFLAGLQSVTPSQLEAAHMELSLIHI